MRGAVTAGHRLTAEAGAPVLAEGGNAGDACIAGAFASGGPESTLTGPGAGGFILVHRGSDSSTRVLDHFVAVPGLGLARRGETAMESAGVDFTTESTQSYGVGAASCAVPGAVAGLGEAHRRFASLPWRVLLEPAIEHARAGVLLTEPQAYLHKILDLILRRTDEGKEMYGSKGNRLVARNLLVLPDLARTLERLAEHGADDFYRGELARALSEHLRAHGGDITPEDLSEYRVVQRRPVRIEFLGHEFASNPPPSTSGVLLGLGLRPLHPLGAGGPARRAGGLGRSVGGLAGAGG